MANVSKNTPNVYLKLQTVRVELQKKNLKKSGKNTFAKFSYFELDDFLAEANQLFFDHGLCSVFSVSDGVATLRIIDVDDPQQTIDFASPLAEVILGGKGINPIQALGAQRTYIRRYLFLSALEISEGDVVDSTIGQSSAPPQVRLITTPQIRRITELMGRKGVDVDRLRDVVWRDYKKKSLKELSERMAEQLIRRMDELEDTLPEADTPIHEAEESVLDQDTASIVASELGAVDLDEVDQGIEKMRNDAKDGAMYKETIH